MSQEENNEYKVMCERNEREEKERAAAKEKEERYNVAKQKVVEMYEKAEKNNNVVSFNQYCRIRWAEEKKIENIPDEKVSNADWQKILELLQVEKVKRGDEDILEDVPDVKNGVKGIKDRIIVRLKVVFGEAIKENEWTLADKVKLTAENAVFFDLLLRAKTDSLNEIKDYMRDEIKEEDKITDGYWICEVDVVKNARRSLFKEIIVRGVHSLEKNAILGTEVTKKLKWVILQYFPEESEEEKSCMMETFEQLSDLVQNYEYNCSHDVDANRTIYIRMSAALRKCMKKLQKEAKHLEFYEEENDLDELEELMENIELS